MKAHTTLYNRSHKAALVLFCLLGCLNFLNAQDSTAVKEEATEAAAAAPKKSKPVPNTFENIWLLDNQSVMVPTKGSFQLDFMHRFGTIDGGYQSLFGLFGGINIRIGADYVPREDLMVGLSLTEYNLTWEGYVKYAGLKQTKDNKIPVSVTYYGNMSVDTRSDPTGGLYPHGTDRLMFFNQIIIARKFGDRFSIQVAPSLTHVNVVQGYYPGDTTADGKSVLGKEMKHDHFAIAVSGKVKLNNTLNLLLNYDQPLTKHLTNNPNPNLSAGLEINTTGHTFQVLVGNYRYITPSRNNYYNNNDYKDGQWLIGFNMTRLWNW
ncbi:DUF5777 family beta-barrel protein [Pinibacter aurantiacus]|uniref:DUF5777 domain-containing protein n=1 Tax=Pinibacter aurantiacus TaxID=2851599 RepID=A0A9E2S7V8_9BACT|nr:DUF5777 family beta-barrel protein [Pinibacter aurantiacus]MBV4357237.1 hypothetical protein [Pinibacter aurantiacus]